MSAHDPERTLGYMPSFAGLPFQLAEICMMGMRLYETLFPIMPRNINYQYQAIESSNGTN